MTQAGTSTQARSGQYEGTDYVCPNCGCEIMVKHAGDQAKGYGRSKYVCSCGTPMELEHGSTTQANS